MVRSQGCQWGVSPTLSTFGSAIRASIHACVLDRSDQIMMDDVFARLTTFHNVLVTGHQAFFTREALEQIASTTIRNLSDFEDGRTNENTLKPK